MMFLVTIPIIVPYWKQFGLTMKEVYQLQAVFGLMMIILDVPAGYLSDLFGRKKCLIIVGIINAITYQILLHGKTFHELVFFEISAAIGFALYSGCDVALIYDSLDANKDNEHKLETVHYLGKRVFFSQMGETVAAILGGALAYYSLSLPVKINAVTATIPFFVALTFKEPPRQKLSEHHHLENIKFIFKNLFLKSPFLTSLIVFNIFYGFSTFLAVWAYQSYWAELKISVNYFGFLWAIFNLLVAFLATRVSGLEKKWGLKTVLLIVALSPALAYLGLGLSYHYLGVLLLFFFALTRAFNSVVIQHRINESVPSSMRATTNSFCSLGMRALFFCVGPWFGILIDKNGVHHSFLSVGYGMSAMFAGGVLIYLLFGSD